MQSSNRAHKEEVLDVMVYELTDTELEIICGGQGTDDAPGNNSMDDLNSLGGMPNMQQMLSPLLGLLGGGSGLL